MPSATTPASSRCTASATKSISSACRFRFNGWLLDADTFQTRANNFLDHSNIGESSIYYPVTVDGALIQAWELTLRSPRLWRLGQVHLAYSNQIAQQRGAITGGLICYSDRFAGVRRRHRLLRRWITISATH